MQSFIQLNKRDKKAFLNEERSEAEENDRVGRPRDRSKKTEDIKGTFHARMGKIKDRNSKDLRETEQIEERWQEYTEELDKKGLSDPDNHDGVVTHLEPDILKSEAKWTLGSITTNKASGGNEIPAELFQILKNDAVKGMHSICQQIWKTQQWSQDQEKSVFISIPKKGNAKEWKNSTQSHNCTHFICQYGNAQNLSSQASEVHELRNSSCTSWIQKRWKNQISN